MRLSKRLLCGVLAILLVAGANAAPSTFHVSVDTTSVYGRSGALDFNFNPGPLTTQAASLQLLNFSSDGMLSASPAIVGDVAGTLAATLSFDNLSGFNDYFTGFLFGNSLSFDVFLSGPALSAPDGLSGSGSTFAFSMFSDASGAMPWLITNPAGFAYTVDVNLDGSATAISFLTPAVPTTLPEPGSLLLMVSGMASWYLLRRSRRG